MGRPATVFLFAHQDDELGVFHVIRKTIAEGKRPVCVYLTDGAGKGVRSSVRNAETIAVLGDLGVARSDIHFVGDAEGISDGKLNAQLQKANDALASILESIPQLDGFIVMAWEGGHEDHDAAHWIGVHQAHHRGLLDRSFQYALYRSSGRRPIHYSVLSPLPQNGRVISEAISFRDRLRFIRLCLRYKSQWTAMAGLLPFVALHYISRGSQDLQPLSFRCFEQRPHEGPLLYEIRCRAVFDHEQFKAQLSLPE